MKITAYLIQIAYHVLNSTFLQKNKKNPPVPPPNETPTFYRPGKTKKNAYEAPRSNIVQEQLDARTEYMHIIDDNMPEEPESHLGSKLHLPHLHHRR